MPLILSVVRDGQPLRDALVTPEKTLWIGRGDTSDLRLDETEGTRLSSVRIWKGECLLIAMGCTAVVGSVPLCSGIARIIRPGDSIEIDGTNLRLDERDDHLAMPVSNSVIAERWMAHGTSPDARLIRVTEGPNIGQELVILAGKTYVVGRGNGCDLTLDDVDVSRRHLTIEHRGVGAVVTDLRSSNGTQLGTTRVAPEHPSPWKAPTMIRLGSTVLGLTF